MAQTQKHTVREAMLVAAREVFAEAGFAGATMGRIAKRAGVGTGNLYRYFDGKASLFEAACPERLAAEHLELVRRRVTALVASEDLESLGAEARESADALLTFWIAHRREVVILLSRADGTQHGGHRAAFVELLMEATLARLEGVDGSASPVLRRTARQVFDNTVSTIVAILEEHDDADAIREAFAAFWSYQLAGLAGLTRWATR